MTCGIYMLTLGTKRYVGQSVRIESRWRAHNKAGCEQRLTKSNPFWQNCFNKHGITKYEILQECTREELSSLERHYIATLKPELNIHPGGIGGRAPGIKFSAEHRAKMSKAHLGKPLSAEHRAKMSKARLGRTKSAEHVAKCVASKALNRCLRLINSRPHAA
jgi:group I intron endonuclease